MARDWMRDEDVDTSLADKFGIPRTFKTAEGGPHVIVTPDHNPFPGLVYTVLRDGYQMGCLTKIDSRRRTATIYGLPLVWIANMETLGYDFELSPEETERIDRETRVLGPMQEKRFISMGRFTDGTRVQLPKSSVLRLNGVEVDFADREFEIPYDTVLVEPEKPDDPYPLYMKYKKQVPRHWAFWPVARGGL